MVIKKIASFVISKYYRFASNVKLMDGIDTMTTFFFRQPSSFLLRELASLLLRFVRSRAG